MGSLETSRRRSYSLACSSMNIVPIARKWLIMKNHSLKSDSNTSDCLSHFLSVDELIRKILEAGVVPRTETFGGNGTPSGVCSAARRSAALRSVGLKLRMPSRATVA